MQDEGLGGLYKPQAGGNRGGEAVVQDWINNRCERVRKLSCSLQLSHEDDYDGVDTLVLNN